MAGVPVEHRDVVVIGGGPAGLAAALGARRAGAGDVLLVERDRRPGGILNQCIHDGFGLFLYKDSLTGPEYAERLVEDAGREGVRILTGAMVLDLAPGRLLRVNARDGYRLIQARSVVLAMGCRERTREMIEIPGNRPAGIFTAGAAQNLVNLQNIRIGRDAVILGSGDIGLIMARRLTLEGLRVRGVFEIMPWAGGLERNVRQCLLDFGIPLALGTTIVDVRGRDRVEAVVTARVGADLKPIAGTECEVACDTLLLSVGLIPENELSRAAGVALSPLTGGAAVDESFMTSVPGIFSCGNVLHIHDVADFASDEGFAAGAAAARFARGDSGPAAERLAITAGEGIRYALPQLVRAGAGNVEIKFRVTRPRRGARVAIRGAASGRILLRKACARLLPSEMRTLRFRQPVTEPLEIVIQEDQRGGSRKPALMGLESAGAPGTSSGGNGEPGGGLVPALDRLTCILCPVGCELEVRRLDPAIPENAVSDAVMASRSTSGSDAAGSAVSGPAGPDAGAKAEPDPASGGATGCGESGPERRDVREGLAIRGHRCDKGVAFAVEEVLHPRRNLTASVPLAGCLDRTVAVRLTGPIPRKMIFPVLAAIARLRPPAPVRRGQVLLADVLGTGTDVVATRTET